MPRVFCVPSEVEGDGDDEKNRTYCDNFGYAARDQNFRDKMFAAHFAKSWYSRNSNKLLPNQKISLVGNFEILRAERMRCLSMRKANC